MKNLKLPFLILSLFTALGLKAEDNKLKAFETDGCTMFVDGTNSRPELWKTCCIEHDLRYWYGGSLSDMDEADNQIKICVEKVAGNAWAQVIYTGISAGHHSPIKNKYQ